METKDDGEEQMKVTNIQQEGVVNEINRFRIQATVEAAVLFAAAGEWIGSAGTPSGPVADLVSRW